MKEQGEANDRKVDLHSADVSKATRVGKAAADSALAGCRSSSNANPALPLVKAISLRLEVEVSAQAAVPALVFVSPLKIRT